MDAELADGEVRVGGDARQRFHDARGYGRPLSGNEVALAPVEAAHLLYRGDLTSVDGMGFRAFLTAQGESFGPRFLVYLDLRDRGFYLSPAREGWVDDPAGTDFVVYPRGKGPADDEIAYRVRVVGERTPVPAADLGGETVRSLETSDGAENDRSPETSDGAENDRSPETNDGAENYRSPESSGDAVLAVVDEEGDLTYLETSTFDPAGDTAFHHEGQVSGTLLADRVLVWDPPEPLHEQGFYGQPLEGRAADFDVLHLSLVEAAYLAAQGVLELEDGGGVERLVERGREVEGERFDRRLRTYRALRDGQSVPKTGFKFGADFRVYRAVESVSELGHSEFLVRVLPAEHTFSPRDLALDVRLAHGVRKRMVFALDGANGNKTRWLAVRRLTP